MKVFTSMIENEIIKNITFKLKDFYLNTYSLTKNQGLKTVFYSSNIIAVDKIMSSPVIVIASSSSDRNDSFNQSSESTKVIYSPLEHSIP